MLRVSHSVSYHCVSFLTWGALQTSENVRYAADATMNSSNDIFTPFSEGIYLGGFRCLLTCRDLTRDGTGPTVARTCLNFSFGKIVVNRPEEGSLVDFGDCFVDI